MQAQRLLGGSLRGVAEVPAGIGGQGHGQIRQPNTGHFIPIRVDSRDEYRVRLSKAWRQTGGDAMLPLWSKVEPLWLRQNGREDFTG